MEATKARTRTNFSVLLKQCSDGVYRPEDNIMNESNTSKLSFLCYAIGGLAALCGIVFITSMAASAGNGVGQRVTGTQPK